MQHCIITIHHIKDLLLPYKNYWCELNFGYLTAVELKKWILTSQDSCFYLNYEITSSCDGAWETEETGEYNLRISFIDELIKQLGSGSLFVLSVCNKIDNRL